MISPTCSLGSDEKSVRIVVVFTSVVTTVFLLHTYKLVPYNSSFKIVKYDQIQHDSLFF